MTMPVGRRICTSRPLRRIAILVIEVVLLGTLATYAVAIGLARWSVLGPERLWISGHPFEIEEEWRYGFGVRQRSAYDNVLPRRELRLGDSAIWRAKDRPRGLDAWADEPVPANAVALLCSTYQAGWPFLCVGSALVSYPGFDETGTPVLVRESSVFGGARRLPRPRDRLEVTPIRPIWAPFIANVLILGTALVALRLAFVCGYRAAIRAHRRKRNRCMRCGYDLQGLQESAGCPECGA